MKLKRSVKLVDSSKVDTDIYSFCGAESIVLTHDNNIALQRRGDNWRKFPGYFSAFGGKIEQGETPLQALIRELNEELGAVVNASDVVFLGAVTEDLSHHSELIYTHFWHDKNATITGCYEGEIRYFESVKEAISLPKIMDSACFALGECLQRGFLQI